MSETRNPGLAMLRGLLSGLSAAPLLAPELKQQQARTRAALARESQHLTRKPMAAKSKARSDASRRGHEERPASQAMKEIAETHFPPWYFKHRLPGGGIPRGPLRKNFASDMVELFHSRGKEIEARSVLNKMPMWVRELEASAVRR